MVGGGCVWGGVDEATNQREAAAVMLKTKMKILHEETKKATAFPFKAQRVTLPTEKVVRKHRRPCDQMSTSEIH